MGAGRRKSVLSMLRTSSAILLKGNFTVAISVPMEFLFSSAMEGVTDGFLEVNCKSL